MPKNPLVPTPVVNKNGVATTVHKRADNTTGQNVASLPAPAVSLQDSRHALARVGAAITDTYDENDGFDDYGVRGPKVLAARFAKYSPEVINAYDKAILDHPGGGCEELLISSLHNQDDSDRAGYILFIAQHDTENDKQWSWRANGTYTYKRATSVYAGLRSLDGEFDFDLPESIYDTDDHRSVSIISSLITVTNKVYLHGGDGERGLARITEPEEGYTLNSDTLIDLIVRRPEDTQRIAELVIDRDNPHGDLIEEILDAEVPALSDGLI